jgi:V8-like Glu-specific endopeptidase
VNMNLPNQILKNNSSIFSVMVSIFVFLVTSIPAQAGKIEDTIEQTTVQINSLGNGSPGGSGVIIDKRGKIYTVLTANHVVCEAIEGRKPVTCATDVTYTIRTHNGKDYPIKDRQIFQKNPKDPDLAIVTFEAQENYPVAALGNSEEIKIGAEIKVTGFPSIFGNKGKDRTYTVTPGTVVTFNPGAVNGYRLVYNATTFVGNSGGPVFDGNGRVIGIHGLADADGGDDNDSGQSETRVRRKPITPVKKPKIGQQETGTSGQGKTGFNAAIPINIFFSLTGQKPPTGGEIPPKKAREKKEIEVATRGNTGNFPASMDKLAKLLSQGDWKGADEETKSLMLEISQASGSLNDKAISRLSCGNLSAINQIWQTQSQGRFGFSAQAQKWKSLFGNKFEPTNEHFEDFATDLGWRYRGRYLSNNQLKYSLDAPKGYLPRAFLDGPVWGNFIAYFDGCKIK